MSTRVTRCQQVLIYILLEFQMLQIMRQTAIKLWKTLLHNLIIKVQYSPFKYRHKHTSELSAKVSIFQINFVYFLPRWDQYKLYFVKCTFPWDQCKSNFLQPRWDPHKITINLNSQHFQHTRYTSNDLVQLSTIIRAFFEKIKIKNRLHQKQNGLNLR